MVSKPTEVHCDSAGAMDWAKFGKLTVGNKHLALAYHDVQQWIKDGEMMPIKVATDLNRADVYTKSPTVQKTAFFLKWLTGYGGPPLQFVENSSKEILKITEKRADEEAKIAKQPGLPQ